MSTHRVGAGLAIGLAFLAVATTLSSAAVITVRSDGTGDYTTVAEAVARSSAGDEIEIGPGSYHEPDMTVAHDLTVRSTDGAEATTLSGTAGIFRFQEAKVVVKGVRFTASNNPGIGAITFVQGATGDVRDCVFDDNLRTALGVTKAASVVVSGCVFRHNSNPASAGALYVSGAGSEINLQDCLLEDNSASLSGGAIAVALGARLTATGCTFRNNGAISWGGAVHVMEASTADMSGNLFLANHAVRGSAVYSHVATVTMLNNTFHANVSSSANNATVYLESSQVSFSRNLVTGDPFGAGLAIPSSNVRHECNLYWDNEGGSIRDGDPSPDELELDPVYCDPDAGDFTVSVNGPAAPAHSACGLLIGALPAVCDIPPDVITGAGDMPAVSALHQNVPNPFNPMTRIRYSLAGDDSRVTLRVFDVNGRLVRTLVDDVATTGPHEVIWDGRDERGSPAASGVYFYRLEAPGFTKTRKMALIR